MNQANTAVAEGSGYRQPRYRHRLFLGLALLACSAAATFWVVWGALVSSPSGSSGNDAGSVDLASCVKLGLRSIVAIVLCGGVLACATHPIRRARADFARLALAEVVLAGFLLAAVVTVYWLAWSPLSFLK